MPFEVSAIHSDHIASSEQWVSESKKKQHKACNPARRRKNEPVLPPIRNNFRSNARRSRDSHCSKR